MLFKKPVINMALGNSSNGLYNDQKYLNYNHYDRVVKSGAVAAVKEEVEIYKEIEKALSNSKIRIEKQQDLIDLQIGVPLEGTSKRIIESINTL